MRCLVSFILLYLVTINVNAFDYDRSFLAEIKPKISEQCYKDLLKGDKTLRKFIDHAVSVWNPTTPGLLNGSHDYVGNYEECVDSDSNPVVMQYCVFDVAVTYEGETPLLCSERPQLGFKPCPPGEHTSPGHVIKWALCAVSSCSKSNLLTLAEVLLQKSDIGGAGLPYKVSLPENTCQTSIKIPFRSETILFFWLVGAIATIVTICTVWHWIFRRVTANNPKLKAPILVRNWSVIEHFSSLMAPFPSDIQVFHSMKVTMVLMVILSHEIIFLIAGPVANVTTVYKVLESMRYLRADLFVDTFFMIAAFIVAKNYSFLSSYNVFDLIMTRYFRIVPVFALVVFYVSSVLEYTGSGPFWPIITNVERDCCKKNWLPSLLMVGNYGDWSEYCWIVGWYLPCDFQLFIVGVLVCRLIKKNEKLGVAAIITFLVTAIVFSAAHITRNNELALLPLADDTFRAVRETPGANIYKHTEFRLSGYLMGMLGGYITHALTRKKITISQRTARVGFLVSGAILVFTFCSGYFYGSEHTYSVTRAAVYGSLVRPVWCFGVALFTIVAELSKNPKVTAFASLRIWAPLSRLTFSMYLVHMVILFPDMGSQIQPLVVGVSVLLVRILVHLVLTVLLALVVYLCVERPFYGLFLIILASFRMLGKSKIQ